jgi:hypothetical protein
MCTCAIRGLAVALGCALRLPQVRAGSQDNFHRVQDHLEP